MARKSSELHSHAHRSLERILADAKAPGPRRPEPAGFKFLDLVGCSQKMLGLLRTARKVASCDATVLIQGESGTGKELLARSIHELSARRGRPFMVVNCSTVVDTLMESELFGHERGAFTGAEFRRAGTFELAGKGTVLLDEIADLPLSLQPKLLRIVQEREFHRVGGTVSQKTDVRILCSTNRDIMSMVIDGAFRPDLFYRLRVVRMHVPPLRERPEEIPVLAMHFLRKYAARHNRKVRAIKGEAMTLLRQDAWPGNVRALEHAIERAVVLADGPTLGIDAFRAVEPAHGNGNGWEMDHAVKEFQKGFVLRALAHAGGNRREAARLMRVSHTKLYRLLETIGLDGAENGWVDPGPPEIGS